MPRLLFAAALIIVARMPGDPAEVPTQLFRDIHKEVKTHRWTRSRFRPHSPGPQPGGTSKAPG